MNRQAIIERVKIVLDEYTPVNQGVVHPIDTYIDPILYDSVRTLLKEFPIDKLWHEPFQGTAITGDNHLKVIIPDNVIRVASVKLSLWPRLIHEREFHATDSVVAAWQNNPVTKASTHRPLVIKHQRLNGTKTSMMLECHGTSSGINVEELNVVKLRVPEELNDDLITPLVYLVASLVATHIERQDIAKPIYEQYLKHLQ